MGDKMDNIYTFRKLLLEICNENTKSGLIAVNKIIGSDIPAYFEYKYLDMATRLRLELISSTNNFTLVNQQLMKLKEEQKCFRKIITSLNDLNDVNLMDEQIAFLKNMVPLYIKLKNECWKIIEDVIINLNKEDVDNILLENCLMRLNYVLYITNNLLYVACREPLIWATSKDVLSLNPKVYSALNANLYCYNLEKMKPTLNLVKKNKELT